MRSRRTVPSDEALLEPVAVFDDGVVVEPEPVVEPVTSTSARETVHEVLDAVRAVLDERGDMRGRRPWAPPVEVQVRSASFHTTFNRLIALSPKRLPELPAWWSRTQRDGRIRISRRLTLEQPPSMARDTWRAPGRLRSPLLLRSIPVELLLWPYVGGWTRMSLEPQRAVHAGRFYFRRGHRVLDALTRRLVTEL
jgi:hypothetical protein